ncbi:hypothetical protein T05_12683 [Trichinella murrelli]|uniref:Uncharacterized protein n=1 Tax=Trichinella murrelli TaxID=144512 RepID=A0A0V0T0V7_9BILA|nr:hypothetical protein T05_12683 [Trichinella murrelli]
MRNGNYSVHLRNYSVFCQFEHLEFLEKKTGLVHENRFQY